MARFIIIWCVCLSLIGACAPEPQTARESAYTLSPATAPGKSSSRPAVSRIQTPIADSTLTAQPDRSPSNLRYKISAVLDWPTHTLKVEQIVDYRNDTGDIQSTVVFNVDVNQEPGDFALRQVTNAGHPIKNYTLKNTGLAVPLYEPLKADGEVELVLDYDLTLPELVGGYRGQHLGYWGYGPRQVNLGMWFPLVAAFEPGSGWVTPATYWLGEYFVLRTADFVVELTIEGAAKPVRVAGPGKVSRPKTNMWRFELSGGREVALSLSEDFRVLSTSTASGVSVDLFYMTDPADPSADMLDAARHALRTAVDALSLYETLFGPYPHSRMAVVEADFPDGMEFSGLVFVSQDWFRAWKHIPDDWLTLITAHEVAHQWWYGLIGSDQGQYPYLDEMLALYSEYLFIEHYYPDYRDWWWNFRVKAFSPQGYVDTPIYDFYSPREYINAVYLQGARMMESLRAALGDKVFLAWLRAYTDQMRDKIAYPIDFWGTLPSPAYVATANVRSDYLRHPDILPVPDTIP